MICAPALPGYISQGGLLGSVASPMDSALRATDPAVRPGPGGKEHGERECASVGDEDGQGGSSRPLRQWCDFAARLRAWPPVRCACEW